MLDKDLAELYEVETRVLVQAVKRNIKRFPTEFMFQLTQAEFQSLRSQFVISNSSGRGGRRYPPYAFTEHGIAMLSTILNSEKAIQVNIAIIRAFIQLRKILVDNKLLREKVEKLERKYDEQFQQIFAVLELMIEEEGKPKSRIGFLTEARARKKGRQGRDRKHEE